MARWDEQPPAVEQQPDWLERWARNRGHPYTPAIRTPEPAALNGSRWS
jgi:hypothetical protein